MAESGAHTGAAPRAPDESNPAGDTGLFVRKKKVEAAGSRGVAPATVRVASLLN